MPWPLSDNLVLSGHPSYEQCADRWWTDSGVCMITLCKKKIDERIPQTLDWYEYMPIPDGRMTVDREAVIWRARDTVIAMMTRPGSRLTVVHCLAGRNRSALVAGLALQYQNNWTGQETLDWMRRCRPNSIHNEHFEVFLRGLGRPR